MKNLAQRWVDRSVPNWGISAQMNPEVMNDAYGYGFYGYYASRSTNAPNDGYRPRLTVTYAPPRPPGPATAVAAATAGDRAARVTWQPPTDRGSNAPIDAYWVQTYSGNTFVGQRSFSGNSTSAVITDLSPGVEYYFAVVAHTVGGFSTSYAYTNVIRALAAPGPPINVRTASVGSVTAGRTRTTVTWEAPTSEGSAPLNKYWVSLRQCDGDEVAASGSLAADLRSWSVEGTEPGRCYQALIYAGSSIGWSPRAAGTRTTAIAAPPADGFAPEVGVRRFFGLSVHPVDLANAVTLGHPSGMELNVPLLDAEVAELRRRDAASAAVQQFLVDNADFRSGYAGHWIDNAEGGLLRVRMLQARCGQTTREGDCLNEQLVAQLQQASPVGSPISVLYDADFTQQQLLTAQDDLNTDDAVARQAKDGFTVLGSDIDVKSNSVVVFVSAAEAGVAAAALPRPYAVQPSAGPVVLDVREAPDYRRRGTGQAFGGQVVVSAEACSLATSGFGANGQYFLITAGHCGNTSGPAAQGNGSGPSLGSVQRNSLQRARETGTSTDCDCAVVGPVPFTKTSTDVLVDGNGRYAFDRVANNMSYGVGMRVCQNGVTSFEAYGRITCGEIRSSNYSGRGPGGVRQNSFVRVTVPPEFGEGSRPGDSGATWGAGRLFMGVNQGRVERQPIFSRSSRLEAAVGVAPCVREVCQPRQPC